MLYCGLGASLVAQTVKNLLVNAGDPGLTPGLGRSLGEKNGYPLQYFCLENSMDRGDYSPGRSRGLDTTERLSIHTECIHVNITLSVCPTLSLLTFQVTFRMTTFLISASESCVWWVECRAYLFLVFRHQFWLALHDGNRHYFWQTAGVGRNQGHHLPPFIKFPPGQNIFCHIFTLWNMIQLYSAYRGHSLGSKK